MRRTAAIVTGMVTAISMGAVPAPAAAEPVKWKNCKSIAPTWNQKDDRSECALIEVPFDHTSPGGRQVKLAISRLRATDTAHRRGVLLVNPGGPGAGGTQMPFDLTNSQAKDLNNTFDLIGFDVRGLGYSDRMTCVNRPEDTAPVPAEIARNRRESLRFRFEQNGAARARCANTDPAFTATMTTQTMARDMDVIRRALGERKISFLGLSWGTALGARYRTLFDGNVDRMLLESVLPPHTDLAAIEDGQAKATEAQAQRYFRWLAERNDTYRLGGRPEQVRTRLLNLRAELERSPRDLGDQVDWYDGTYLSGAMSPAEKDWAKTGRALRALAEGGVPEADKAAPKADSAAPEAPGARAVAEGKNVADGKNFKVARAGAQGMFARQAVNCNDSAGARDFEQAWRNHEARAARYPAGEWTPTYDGMCAHWPLPPQVFDAGPGDSALLLVGHRNEANTPLEFALAMQRRIGGDLLVINDDQHTSMSRLPCAALAVDFFAGRRVTGECDARGVPHS